MQATRIQQGFLLALTLSIFCLTGCFGGGPGAPPPGDIGGFFVYTVDVIVVGGVPEPPTPHPGVAVGGAWVEDIGTTAAGNVFDFEVITDDQGQDFITDGRIPAVWQSGVTWNVPCGTTFDTGSFNVTIAQPYIAWECKYLIAADATPSFSLSGSLPSTFNVQYTGISSTYGMPQMNVYKGTSLISHVTASNVSAGGTSATFSFPKPSSGSLGSAFYTFNLANENSAGVYQGIGTGFFSVGSNNTSQTTPYGIDAFDTGSYVETCITGKPCTQSATTSSGSGYIDTLATPGKVCLNDTACVAVGAYPTSVKAYGSAAKTDGENTNCVRQGTIIICTITIDYVTEPQYAINTNYGSNTATIVSIPTMTVSATLPVGNQPVAVALDSTQTNAYVANYGSSSITKINLASKSVVGTLAVGRAPAALALDPSGTSLWVGGLNYISNVNLSNFSVTSTTSVSGQITSLGISAAQNAWVFTAISSDLSTFTAEDVTISNPGTIHSDAVVATAGTLFSGSGTGSTPPPYLNSNVVVSASDGNGVAVTSSPTGFVVLDLVAHTQIMQGTTAIPVRGIAVDPAQSVAYLTAPASNSVITAPLPSEQ